MEQKNFAKYKLRAECLGDILKFLKKRNVGKYIVECSLKRDKAGRDVHDNAMYLSDFTMEFVTDRPLDELTEALRDITDGHVMAETIKPIGEYTGERTYNE